MAGYLYDRQQLSLFLQSRYNVVGLESGRKVKVTIEGLSYYSWWLVSDLVYGHYGKVSRTMIDANVALTADRLVSGGEGLPVGVGLEVVVC